MAVLARGPAVFAWRGAEVAVVGAEAAVGIMHRRRPAMRGAHDNIPP
ncbi:hypothetical protein ACQP2K_25715 [Microbispora siamensis]